MRLNVFSPIEFLIKKILFFLLYIYRVILKPLLFTTPCCRFDPSCSEYAKQALEQFSLPKALLLITKRICKCHPFGSYGYDPIPHKKVETKYEFK